MPPDQPEVWLRGPVPDIPPFLQPVAHALLQAREEVTALMKGFPDDLLWRRPGGVASVGFHLQHLRGVLDRLFTYARGEALTAEQLRALKAEGQSPEAVKTIDRVLTEAGGFKMGPFALMDLIGIDVNFAVTQSVYEATFHEARYRPSPIQQKMVEAGLLGRKTGRGFYEYD